MTGQIGSDCGHRLDKPVTCIFWVPHETIVGVTLVIRKDQHDVGRLRVGSRNRGDHQEKRKQAENVFHVVRRLDFVTELPLKGEVHFLSVAEAAEAFAETAETLTSFSSRPQTIRARIHRR